MIALDLPTRRRDRIKCMVGWHACIDGWQTHEPPCVTHNQVHEFRVCQCCGNTQHRLRKLSEK
jgi:hypothetical protein